jgi:hypothetical protein
VSDEAALQAKEIDDIIGHYAQRALVEEMYGHDLLAMRQECSRAIAAACERHRKANNPPPPPAAET